MFFHQFFFITQSEKRGMIALLLLIGVLLATRVVMAQYGIAPTSNQMLQEFPVQAYKDTTEQACKSAKKAHFTERIQLDINTADTTAFKQLRGIGSTFANRIVRYRTQLGGFYRVEQLLEVYHFPVETYQQIKDQLIVDATHIQKLPINQLSIKDLKKHPYIGYFQAKSLYDNRLKRPNQRYDSLQDLVEDKDVTSDFIQRLAPYLSFQ